MTNHPSLKRKGAARWVVVRQTTALGLLIVAGCTTPTSHASAGQGGSPFGSKGAPWTIQCLEIKGPARMQQIEPFAESLRRTTGIRSKDVFVRDEPDGFARLYYGTYYRHTDPKTRKRSTPPQLQKDMELIKQLGSPSGQRYFLQALAVRMPMPDVGDPLRALSQAKGRYSLQVACSSLTTTSGNTSRPPPSIATSYEKRATKPFTTTPAPRAW